MYGYYNDSRFKNEFIYPARLLSEMEGSVISQITFYSATDTSWNSNLELTIDEVADTSYTGYGASWKASADAQLSWTGSCSVVSGQWTITLDEPYYYGGGNLLISIRNTAAGSGCPHSAFYGISSGSAAASGYNTGASPSMVSTVVYFRPKATFIYTEGGSVCSRVRGLSVSDILTDGATISWTENGSATAWVIDYNGQTIDASTNPYTLTSLEANTSYTVAVMAVCGDGEQSEYSTPYTFSTANVGIDNVGNTAITIYPNPANSTVTLKGIEGKVTVTIVDINGHESGEWTVANGALTIDVSKMAPGAYFVRIVGEQVNAIRKLIVR